MILIVCRLIIFIGIQLILMKSIRKKLGNRIRQLRHEKNISQEELADKCSLHRTYIGGIERGERNPSLDNLEKISKALEVELFELFRGMDAK